MAIRVAINGLGRIGRAFVRRAHGRDMDSTGSPQVEIVAVNDLGSLENLAYLLQYDSVYRRAPFTVEAKGGALLVDGREVKFLQEKDPAKLPWKDLAIDVVVESTGFFTHYDQAEAHITAGAKHVVISAPGHGEHDPGEHPLGATVLMGVNEDRLKTCQISSNGSCTTNAASPIVAILDEGVGVEKAVLTTTHAYTTSQSLVDGPSKKDIKEGRAAALNITPTSTGAAVAVTKAYVSLDGNFDGIALRVPVPAGSIADITFIAKRPTSKEEINKVLREAAKDPRWEGVFSTTDEALVSSDIIGEAYGAIADLGLTRVVGGNLVKVSSWYDNEMGYTETLVRHVIAAAAHLNG